MKPFPNQNVRVYADFLLIDREKAGVIINNGRKEIVYNKLSDLWAVKQFAVSMGQGLGCPNITGSNSQRVAELTPINKRLSTTCHNLFREEMKSLRSFTEGKPYRMNEELARLFVVKEWVIALHSVKIHSDINRAEAIIVKAVGAVFQVWKDRLAKLNRGQSLNHPQDYNFMGSAYPFWVKGS